MITVKQEHYLRIYRKADAILRQPDNPCQIQLNDQGLATCIQTRQGREGFAPPGKLCCGGCAHLGPRGCTVESLMCKLGWCFCHASSIPPMETRDHPVFESIAQLKGEAVALGVPMKCRASFEENFR